MAQGGQICETTAITTSAEKTFQKHVIDRRHLQTIIVYICKKTAENLPNNQRLRYKDSLKPNLEPKAVQNTTGCRLLELRRCLLLFLG